MRRRTDRPHSASIGERLHRRLPPPTRHPPTSCPAVPRRHRHTAPGNGGGCVGIGDGGFPSGGRRSPVLRSSEQYSPRQRVIAFDCMINKDVW